LRRRQLFAAAFAAGGALAASVVVFAQSNTSQGGPAAEQPAPAAAAPNAPAGGPTPETPAPPEIIPPPPASAAPAKVAASNALAAKPPAEAKPPEAPKPVRSPAAILQALDKVTAETMSFAAPVGQRVRYKNLVFTVKACETSGAPGAPSPQFAAYVVVESQPPPMQGIAPTPPKQVFKGWMLANSPALHPLQHPVYDAWLIACMAAAPPA
jgi:hypothetical protein